MVVCDISCSSVEDHVDVLFNCIVQCKKLNPLLRLLEVFSDLLDIKMRHS